MGNRFLTDEEMERALLSLDFSQGRRDRVARKMRDRFAGASGGELNLEDLDEVAAGTGETREADDLWDDWR